MVKIEPITVSGISFCAGGLLYDAGALQKACYITCPHNSLENSKRKLYVPVFSQSSVLSSKRGSSKRQTSVWGDDCVWMDLYVDLWFLLLSLVSGLLVAVARKEKTRGGKIFALSATGSQPNKKLQPEQSTSPGSAVVRGRPRAPPPPPARPYNTVASWWYGARHSRCCLRQAQRPKHRKPVGLLPKDGAAQDSSATKKVDKTSSLAAGRITLILCANRQTYETELQSTNPNHPRHPKKDWN